MFGNVTAMSQFEICTICTIGNGNVIGDDKGMCDMLNNFFGSVFTTENVADIPEVNRLFNTEDSQKLNMINIESADVS